jgi:hypothetical protein
MDSYQQTLDSVKLFVINKGGGYVHDQIHNLYIYNLIGARSSVVGWCTKL